MDPRYPSEAAVEMGSGHPNQRGHRGPAGKLRSSGGRSIGAGQQDATQTEVGGGAQKYRGEARRDGL